MKRLFLILISISIQGCIDLTSPLECKMVKGYESPTTPVTIHDANGNIDSTYIITISYKFPDKKKCWNKK